jgi:hypothetical protein
MEVHDRADDLGCNNDKRGDCASGYDTYVIKDRAALNHGAVQAISRQLPATTVLL